MAQPGGRHMYLGVAGTLLLLGGCASHHHAGGKVDEAWVARVPPGQLGDVRQAQLTEEHAREQITRTKVARQDAEKALDVARRKETAAKSRNEAGALSLKAAKERGDAASIAQARSASCTTQHALTLAQAEAAWREDAVKTLKSLEDMRQRELDVARAQLQQAEYEAVNANEDVRARDLSAGDFSSAVAEARRRAADQQRQVDADLQRERQARSRWEQLRDQGYGGSGPSQP